MLKAADTIPMQAKSQTNPATSDRFHADYCAYIFLRLYGHYSAGAAGHSTSPRWSTPQAVEKFIKYRSSIPGTRAVQRKSG